MLLVENELVTVFYLNIRQKQLNSLLFLIKDAVIDVDDIFQMKYFVFAVDELQ